MQEKMSKREFDGIKQIYHNILLAYNDHEYLSEYGINFIKAALIDQNRVLFRRIKYYLFHFTTIELNKLFNDQEDHSIQKYINFELKNRPDDEMKNELMLLNKKIKMKPTKEVIKRIYNLRNKFFAHLDSDRDQVEEAKVYVEEVKMLMDILLKFISIFNVIVEGKEYKSPINKDVLGYKLHEQFSRGISSQ